MFCPEFCASEAVELSGMFLRDECRIDRRSDVFVQISRNLTTFAVNLHVKERKRTQNVFDNDNASVFEIL